MTSDPTYSPSPELVEQQREWFGNARHFHRDYLTAAVAFRHPDGHPELVPWEQVPELWSCPDCAFTMDACHTDVPDGGYSCPLCENDRLRARVRELVEAATVLAWINLRADLAPFTQEPQP